MTKKETTILLILLGLLPSFGLSCKSPGSLSKGEIVLAEPLYFENKSVSEIKKSEIPSLRRLGLLSSPSSTEAAVLHLRTKSGSSVTVHTVDEYRYQIGNGAYADTSVDMAIEGVFKTTDLIFSFLEKSQPAKISYISNPRVGVTNLELMPSTLLSAGITDDAGYHELPFSEGKSIDSLLKEDPSISVTRQQASISFETKQNFFHLRELARADFDGDEIEDILISKGFKVVDGTLGHETYFILIRKDTQSKFSVREVKR